MFINYLKIVVRIIQKNRIFFGINLMGLTIGLSTAILILLYINNELAFDKFHDNYDRIFRVCVEGKISNDRVNAALSNISLAEYLKKNFKEIDHITRIDKVNNLSFVKAKEEQVFTKKFIYTDTSFFEIFKCEWIEGNPLHSLSNDSCIVITKTLAKKLFANEKALGKPITINNKYKFIVNGVINDYPIQSHINFDGIIPINFYFKQFQNTKMEIWGALSLYTYIKLKENVNSIIFEAKIKNVINKNLGLEAKEKGIIFNTYLQPITSIHLHSNLLAEFKKNNDINYIYILSAIALFIVLIACINFMNLSTARAGKRTKEIAMRKVNGASRWELVQQFMGETIFLSLLALMFSLAVVELILPYFNEFAERELTIQMIFQSKFLFYLILLTIAVGLFSGSYPALFLSSFSPINVIKSNIYKIRKKSTFRNILVLFQFSISIVLIICTFIILQQMNFIRHQKLGFSKDNLLMIPIKTSSKKVNLEYIKNNLKFIPEIESIGCSAGIIGEQYNGVGLIPEGFEKKQPWLVFTTIIDDNYLPTMQMKIKMGRNFNNSIADSNSVIINETFQKKLGWEAPLGKKLSDGMGNEITVIGVVEDFNYRTLHNSLEPFAFFYNPANSMVVNIRIKEHNQFIALNKIKEKWYELMPDTPFDYSFLDKSLENQYLFEKKTATLFFIFSFLSIFIACLGLFGLASFTAEQRKKEIGIRKVLGAKNADLIKMLIFDFTKWVAIANIIAYPIAYFAMNNWLSRFAYHTEISIFSFFYATIIAFSIAIITVGFQAIKTSNDNPVNSIKYE